MTATGHALVAALIVAKIPNPYISLPLAFVSHFALDIIPHWDSGTHRHTITKKRLFYEAFFDVLVSVILSLVLYRDILGQSDYVLLYSAVFLSQLPDWLMAPYLVLGSKNKFLAWSKWVYKLQHKMQSRVENPISGILTQIATVVFLYIVLFWIF
jgi:hypothetical protein